MKDQNRKNACLKKPPVRRSISPREKVRTRVLSRDSLRMEKIRCIRKFLAKTLFARSSPLKEQTLHLSAAARRISDRYKAEFEFSVELARIRKGFASTIV